MVKKTILASYKDTRASLVGLDLKPSKVTRKDKEVLLWTPIVLFALKVRGRNSHNPNYMSSHRFTRDSYQKPYKAEF
jgi:hypothetical protein